MEALQINRRWHKTPNKKNDVFAMDATHVIAWLTEEPDGCFYVTVTGRGGVGISQKERTPGLDAAIKLAESRLRDLGWVATKEGFK